MNKRDASAKPVARRQKASSVSAPWPVRPTDLLLGCATIALAASLALPGWTTYSLNKRRGEAFESLRKIDELQTDFYALHQRYSDSYSELEFSPPGYRQGTPVRSYTYSYELSAWRVDGNGAWNFRATATANLDPSDTVLDIVIIENGLTVSGRAFEANTPVILSDDISKQTGHVVSRSEGGATGYRKQIERRE